MFVIGVPQPAETDSHSIKTDSDISPQTIHKDRQPQSPLGNSNFIADISENIQSSSNTSSTANTKGLIQTAGSPGRPWCWTRNVSLGSSQATNRDQFDTPKHIPSNPSTLVSVSSKTTYSPSSELKLRSSTLVPLLTFIDSKRNNTSAAHLPAVPEPPDSDIAQLWDLIRITVAKHSPQQSVTSMSESDTTLPHFQHNLPQITPAQILIPSENIGIKQRCETLASNIPDVINEAQYGSPLTEDAAKQMAQSIATIEDTDQASLRDELKSLVGLTSSGAPPLDRKSSRDSGPTDKNDACSPPLLSQSRLKKISSLPDRAIDPSSTSGKSTHTVSFGMALTPTLIDTKKFPSGYLALLSDFVIRDDFYADFLRIIFTAKTDSALHCARSNLIRHAQEAIFQQLSVPRDNPGEDKQQVIQDTRYYGCIFYGHKVEIWEISYDLVSEPSTTASLRDDLVPTSSKSGTVLKNVSRSSNSRGCSSPRVHTSKPQKVPVLFLKKRGGNGGKEGRKEGGQGSQPSESAPNDVIYSPCHTQCLGTLNTANANDLKLFTEFFYVLIRWGQVKRWTSHVRNLHSYCWSLGGNKPPMKMNSNMTKQHWSSGTTS